MSKLKLISGIILMILGIIFLFFKPLLSLGVIFIVLGVIFILFRHGENVIEERKDKLNLNKRRK